jgi:hypothetical protein
LINGLNQICHCGSCLNRFADTDQQLGVRGGSLKDFPNFDDPARQHRLP